MEDSTNCEQEKREIIELIQETQDIYLIKMLHIFISKLLNKKE